MKNYNKSKDPTSELLGVCFFSLILMGFFLYKNIIVLSNDIITLILLSVSVILVVFFLKYRKYQYLVKSGIDKVDVMSGFDFEQFLLTHFKRIGYSGYNTKKTGDYGADLVLNKDGYKLVLQAKRSKSKIGIAAIQEITAAIKYYNASKGIVITNNYFTKNAVVLAQKNNIELWNRQKLIDIMNKSQGKEIIDQIKSNSLNETQLENEKLICPECGSKLLLRNGKNGQFYGCNSFPKCRYTKNYIEV